jgi:hypothetical protein
MDPADDIRGLAHEARAGADHGCGRGRDLLRARNDDLVAQGSVGRPGELQRRYGAVMAGRRPCPLRDDCPRYQRAIEGGKRFSNQVPRQDECRRGKPVPLGWGKASGSKVVPGEAFADGRRGSSPTP